jgi:hypothetical protein
MLGPITSGFCIEYWAPRKSNDAIKMVMNISRRKLLKGQTPGQLIKYTTVFNLWLMARPKYIIGGKQIFSLNRKQIKG